PYTTLFRSGVGDLFVPEAFAMLHDVEAEIRDDAVDPWSERLAGFESADVFERLDERLLRQVLGIGRVANDAPRDRDHPLHVLRDEVIRSEERRVGKGVGAW